MTFSGSSAAQNSQTMGGNVKPYGQLNATAGSSSIGRYDPYAPPRRPVPSTSTAAASSNTPSKSSSHSATCHLIGVIAIRFKPSPFIRVERAVSGVVECPGVTIAFRTWRPPINRDLTESSSATDRRQQTVTFNLTSDHVAKLSSSK